jgi:hypothetical protein
MDAKMDEIGVGQLRRSYSRSDGDEGAKTSEEGT